MAYTDAYLINRGMPFNILTGDKMGKVRSFDPMSGNVRIAVVIPEDLKRRLDYLCQKEHRSLSGQVHMWIVQKVEEWEANNLLSKEDERQQ